MPAAAGRRWRRRRRGHRAPRYSRLVVGIVLACLGFAAVALWQRLTEPAGEDRSGPVALCSGADDRTCLIDGDTGRDNGRKWRLISIDTPEIFEPGCENERRMAVSARNRLRGIVTAVKMDTVMAQVEMVCGPYRMVSLMSAEAADDLGLEPGVVGCTAERED